MWIVIQHGALDVGCCYGPFTDPDEAGRFAAFVSKEIDPATVHPLRSPVAELLNWRDAMAQERL